MTHILMDIVLLGAFASCAAKLLGKPWTITPRIVPEARPDRQVTTFVRPEPPEPERTKKTAPAPIEAATPVGPPDYLLGGQRAGGAADRTAAMMDMMCGSGVCTPHDR